MRVEEGHSFRNEQLITVVTPFRLRLALLKCPAQKLTDRVERFERGPVLGGFPRTGTDECELLRFRCWGRFLLARRRFWCRAFIAGAQAPKLGAQGRVLGPETLLT